MLYFLVAMVQEEDIHDLLDESEESLTDTAIAYELADSGDNVSQVKGDVRSTLVKMMNERKVTQNDLRFKLRESD